VITLELSVIITRGVIQHTDVCIRCIGKAHGPLDFEIGSVLYGCGVYAPSLKIGDSNNQSASRLFDTLVPRPWERPRVPEKETNTFPRRGFQIIGSILEEDI